MPNNDSFTSIEVDANQTIYYTSGSNLSSFFYKTVNSNDWIQVDYDTSGEFGGCFTEAIINKTRDKVFFRVCSKTFLIENFSIVSQIQPPLGDDSSNIGVLIQTDNGLYTNALDGTILKVFKSLDNGNNWIALGCPNELINYPNSISTILSDELNNIYVQTNPSLDLPTTVSGLYILNETLDNSEFDYPNNIIIYPNPSKSILNIKSNISLNHFTIFDVSGRVIFSVTATSNAIDVSSLSSGAYFLKVDGVSGYSNTLKFVKD